MPLGLRGPFVIGVLPGALCCDGENGELHTVALHANRELSYCFLSYLVSRNIRLEQDLVAQTSYCSERRLARALLLLAGEGDRRKLRTIAGISQGTLAGIIGTTRSRVNLFMNKFKKLGFIKYRGTSTTNGGIHINTPRLAKTLRK